MSYGYLTPAGGFTIELWFNHGSALPAWSEALINQQTQNKGIATTTTAAVNGRQLLVYQLATGEIRIDWRKEDGTQLLAWTDASTAYGNDNAWHFLAVRLATDMKTFTVWIDGEKKTTTALSTVLDWKPGTMSIGGAYAAQLGNFGEYLYTGSIAYVAMWDTALLDARIADHYTAGSGGTVFYGDDEVKRLTRLYDYAGVPTNARRFDPAVTILQGTQIAGQNALQSVQDTTKATAGGLVFADGQSVMVYQNRRHRYNRPVVMSLTEASGSAPDVGMEFTTDDTKVYNDVRASRPYGGSARLRNKASEFEYGPRTYELKLAITSDEEMRNAGTWIAERYGEDRVRVSGVTLSAESSDLIQYLAETISIGDRLAFDDLPDNAPQTYMEFVVEGISVSANFKAETWSLGLELSPAELWDVFQVGVSTLGDGSRIAL